MKLKVTLARLERVSRIGLLLALMPILTLAAVPVRAQTQVFPQWVSSLNGFTTSDVEFDEAGNKYAAKPMASDSLGNTYIVGSALGEMLTIKQDADGRVLWKSWLGSATHPAHGVEIAVDAVGNVYALGSIAASNGGVEWATVKYNPEGSRQWVDYFFRPDAGQNLPAHIAVGAGGDVYVVGTSSFESTTSAASAVAIKYDTNGKQVWIQVIDNCCNTIASVGIGVDAQENVYWAVVQILVTGTDVTTNVYKYDAAGNLLSTTPAGGFISAFQLDSHGNSYVAGTTNFEDSQGDEQPIVAEVKAVGPGWTDVLGSAGSSFPSPASIAPSPDGSVFVSPVPGVAGLTKFSSTGIQLWTVANSGLLAVNSFGDVYVAGPIVTKYDSLGLLIWQQPFEGPSHQPATPTAIAIGGDGGLFVTGTTTINGTPASITIDYVQDAAKLTPASLTFANQILGTESPGKTVTLKNTAEQSLQITSITADGDFDQTNHCPATLAPGASCAVTITFLPIKPGARNGTLTVLDAYEGSPQIVKLTGTGTSE
jgi:hypothetical protein